MTARSRAWSATAIGIAVLCGVTLCPTVAFADPQFPTWAEVQAAKGNAAAKQAEVQKLTGLLSQLEATSARLADIAVEKGEEAHQAQAALDDATAALDRITARAADAKHKADVSTTRAGRLVAQLSRTGGGDVSLALMQGDAKSTDSTLYRLGILSRLSASSEDIVKQAEYDRKSAEALGDQAASARAERQRRQVIAEKAVADAEAAQQAAEQQVASTKAQSDQAYAQLASLNDQTAALNQQYLQGVAWRQEQARQAAARAAAEAAARAAAAAAAAGSSSHAGAGAPIGGGVSAPNGGAVAQAIAYARAQLGEPYAYNGAGPSSWDCSGLTMMAYASAGVSIGGHGATLQYNYLRNRGRLLPISQIAVGDLVFYNDTGDPGDSKDHVAIYVGGGQILEAPRPGVNVRVWSMYSYGRVPYVGRPTA